MNHVIKNVKAALDAKGKITQLSFTGSVTNTSAQEFTQDEKFMHQFAQPAAGVKPDGTYQMYSMEELQSFASDRAAEINMFQTLEAKAIGAMTPVFKQTDAPVIELPTDQQLKNTMMFEVDQAVANVSSNFTRFQLEYEAREKAAQAYKDASYTGDPTTWISAFATSVNMSEKDSTDLILYQASQLREAIRLLGAARMGKYKIQAAKTLDEAKGIHASLMQQISVIAQNLP